MYQFARACNRWHSPAALLSARKIGRLESVRAETTFASLLKMADLDGVVPDYTTLGRRQKTLAVQIPYRRAGGPLYLLVNSTGIKFLGYPSGVGAVSGFLSLRLPVPRHEFVDAVDLVIGQALEDPCQPCFGVDVVHLCRFNELVGDGGCLSAAD